LPMTRIDDEPGNIPTDLRAALNLKSSNMSATLRSPGGQGDHRAHPRWV
jgi:hypothetical protein